jgi:hypothetical protein
VATKRVLHADTRGAASASKAFSLIQNQVHTLPKDSRQLAYNLASPESLSDRSLLTLWSMDLLVALEAPQRADARAVRSDYLSVPLLESSRARLVVRRWAERRNAKKADDDAASEGGGAAPEVTPRRLHCDVNSTQKIPDLGVGTAPRPLLPQQSREKARCRLGGSSRPGAQEIKRGWLVVTRASSENRLSRHLAGKDECKTWC